MHSDRHRTRNFLETGDFAQLPQNVRATRWSEAGLAQVDFPAHDIPDPASPNFVLCLIRQGEAKASFNFGNRSWHGELLPGMFAPVTPPNVAGDIRLGAPQRHLVVSIPSQAVGAIMESRSDDLGVVHETGFRDPLLSQICLSLWEAAEEPEPRGRLFEDYALAALVAGLVRRSEKLGAPKSRARALSDSDWRLIETYIGDRIETDLSLQELAALVGMALHAFIRAFKAHAGCPPHHYVLRRRITYVRELLENNNLSLADIALQAGFADQAHMTSTFARLTGTTPGKLRRLQ